MLILLWGLGSERPLTAVGEELRRLNAPMMWIDQRDVLQTDVTLDVDSGVGGTVHTRHDRIDLSAVTALYLRPYASCCLPVIVNAGPDSAEWRHAMAVDNILLSWSELTPALVVNRLQAMASNSSKPYQLQQIQKCGFSVPKTLLTTDPNAALAFWERHGTVIYKSVSAARSKVSRLRPEHVERLRDVSSCPTQFQQYIAGSDYRVHIVDTEVFACEIRCEADDYRDPGQHIIEIQTCTLPQDVEDRCRALATVMQLSVAGIDLRQNPEGAWYCFEVNPSPAFPYYQEATGQPISSAIARFLARNS